MKKVKETKQILKDWQEFEYRNKLNESQGDPRRKRVKPSDAAKKLANELDKEYGSSFGFRCIDYYDNHSDDEMINIYQKDGFQLIIEAIVKAANKHKDFPNNLKYEDVVITDSDILYDRNCVDFEKDVMRQELVMKDFRINIVKGPTIFLDLCEVNGRKVLRKDGAGVKHYYMFPGSVGSQSNIQFKNKLGGKFS